jgi:hypothetical protein
VPTDTPTYTLIPSDTPVPTDTPTYTPTLTDTPVPTDTPTYTPIPTETPTYTDIPSDTPVPTDTPTLTPTPSDTPMPTATPTYTPTPSNTPTYTDTPTDTSLPQPAGKYDDSSSAWHYAGSWVNYLTSGPYDDTVHYTTVEGDFARFTFIGAKFILTYTGNPDHGKMDIYLDGEKVDSLNEYNSSLQWQQSWTSELLTYERHSIKLVCEKGTLVDIDAIEILSH